MTRYGRQTPTFEAVGEYASTDGPAAVELFGQYGVEFYPSQKHEMDLFLAVGDDGRAACKSISVSKPRQNGKSYAARHYAIWAAAVEGKRVLYTAHHGVTTREMFKIVRNFVEGTPDFAAELSSEGVKRAQGSEGVYFEGGGCVEFATRTNALARGKTYDVIIIDEAQELTDEQADALTPTTIASESGDPQKIYLGTPPNVKCPGTVFRRLHREAHEGGLESAWWLEWAAAEVGDKYDVDRWYECCPAMGYRIREDVMLDAADGATDDGFAREYLGWWSSEAVEVERVISDADWQACRTEDPPADGLLCAGVKFAPDGSRVALAVCLRPEMGLPYVEVVKQASTSRGTRWLAEWILARADKLASVCIDGKRGERTVQMLNDERFPRASLRVPGSADVAKACAMLVDAVEAGEVEHYGQPDLDAAATKCTKRRIGADGFGFDDTDEGDATLIEACALAYREAMTTKVRPGRKLRVG